MSNALSIGGIKTAALSGFKTERLKNAGFGVAGALATNFVSKKALDLAGSVIPKDGIANKVAKVGVTLLTAGLVAYVAKKAVPSRANAILVGGIFAGGLQGLTAFFPDAMKGMSGLGDIADENGWAWNLGDYADLRQMAAPVPMRQPLGDYADPRQIMAPIPTRQPLGDYADPRQIMAPIPTRQPLGNYADQMVGEEIEMSM